MAQPKSLYLNQLGTPVLHFQGLLLLLLLLGVQLGSHACRGSIGLEPLVAGRGVGCHPGLHGRLVSDDLSMDTGPACDLAISVTESRIPLT